MTGSTPTFESGRSGARIFTPFAMLSGAWRVLGRAAHRVSEICRLIRAYNDLAQIDASTLRRIGADREALERVLDGAPVPRRR